jgi:preprotein translocase subunit SecD
LKRRSVVSLAASLALAIGIVGCGGSSSATKTTTTTRNSSLALDLKGGAELILKCRHPASQACHNEAAKL